MSIFQLFRRLSVRFILGTLLFVPASASAAVITIGETAILNGGDYGNGNFLVAQRTTLSQAATIQSLSFYVTTTGGKLRLGIYNATGPGGGPGNKVAETGEITPITGWNRAFVTTPALLPAGVYWLAYLPSSSSLGFLNANDSTSSAKWYPYNYGAMPGTYSVTPFAGTYRWSFYATLDAGTVAPDSVLPSNPGALSASAVTATSINLNWTASTDNVGVTAYQLERCVGSGCTNFALIGTTPGTIFNNTGLTVNSSYSYRVRATDAANNLSGYSNTATAILSNVDATRPTTPSGVTVMSTSSGQIDLFWNASSDNVGVTGYRIYRCTGLACTPNTQIATSVSTSYSNLGLAPSTTYRYRIRAVDAANNLSANSGTVSIATLSGPDVTPPSIPAGLGATTNGSTQINLAWTASTDSGGLTGYQIERCQGPACTTFTQIATTAGTNFSDTTVIGGTSYSYRVRASDRASNLSGYSNVTIATTPMLDTTGPSAPTGLASAAFNATQIHLSWSASTDNIGVTGYRIERCQGAGCTNFSQIGTTVGTSFSDSGVASSTSYSYRVRAGDAAGNLSNYSSVTSATSLAPMPTVVLTANPAIVASGGASILNWSSTNATSCTASGGWSGLRALSGSTATAALTANASYVLSCSGAGGVATASVTVAVATAPGSNYGLEWSGTGAARRMLFWHNPFPIYDATYVFKVFPRKKSVPASPNTYFTTFFWGNDGDASWYDYNGQGGRIANTYYGAHPYPVPAPDGPGQWEIAVYSNDYVSSSEVVWDRWYTQAFRAWRESPSVTHHEFYYDLPDLTKVIRTTITDPNWSKINPPTPAIVIGQTADLNGASWGGYAGWEEFNGIIRGIQMYSGLLSINDILSEIASPKSTAAGTNLIWYLNLNPRPSDVTDQKGIGIPNNPSWSGTTAAEWKQ